MQISFLLTSTSDNLIAGTTEINNTTPDGKDAIACLDTLPTIRYTHYIDGTSASVLAGGQSSCDTENP
jgi:hypothetical protein